MTRDVFVKIRLRDLTPGSEFSIIFCSIAILAIFSCALSSFLYTKYKLKQRCFKYRDHHNDSSSFHPSQNLRLPLTFPSNPAVRPLLCKPSAADVPCLYDPHTQSPFPSTLDSNSQFTTSVTMPDTAHDPEAAPNSSSGGMFALRGVVPTTRPQIFNHCTNVNRADPIAIDSITRSREFGDAKDFILAVPEPLLLKPRPAGKPPAAVRHQERHGTPASRSSDRILHPKKLFQNVNNGDNRISVCSSTSLCVDHRKSDLPVESNGQEMVNVVDQVTKDENEAFISSDAESEREHVNPDTQTTILSTESRNMTPLHRLRSYKSLTKKTCSAMTRAGTITRSKTPVEQMVRMYEDDDFKNVIAELNPPQKLTTSTTHSSAVTPSGRTSISTPPTSPGLLTGTLTLLPTPLRPKPSTISSNLTSSLKAETIELSPLDQLTKVNGHLRRQSSHPSLQVRRCKRASKGFYHANRQPYLKPLKLKLAVRRSISLSEGSECGSTGSINTKIAPLPQRHLSRYRIRASSLYSQDTRGFSTIRTPLSSGFPSPVFEVAGDGNLAQPGVQLKNSHDSVKARIDEWTKRIEGSPSYPETQDQREVLSICRQEMPNTGNQGGREDTDRALRFMHQPDASQNAAPGGAAWI